MPFVQAGDVRLHYVEHGSGPEPLVFIHGYIESVYAWSETLPRLPERYHAFAFDLRGVGLSDKPASDYGPDVYARDLHLATRPLGDEYIDQHIDEDLSWCDAAYEEAWQAMADARLAETITRIRTPTLMVVGERDDLRDANLEDARRIPDCALHLFYRVGHMIQFDVPDAFVALLDDFVQHGAAPPFSPEQRQQVLESLFAST
jgi:pimeloyl-ACP methyl ester carboxylesterase